MNCLYSMVHDSLLWPKVVPVRFLSAFSLLLALLQTEVTWAEKVRWGSRVTPRIVGLRFRGKGSSYKET